ncbi:hypothetical protein EG327_001737, partial [Venturia inaequalis]
MSLKHYLRMAQKEVHLTGKAELDSVQHLDVNLQYERNNLILVYGGSFNPPHRGHIDVLLSGLRPEVGALAIVVLPCEDYPSPRATPGGGHRRPNDKGQLN